MRISVVIPTYNRRQYIGETLRSILAQSSPPDEVIVVDDGSTDGTYELLEEQFPSVRRFRIENSSQVVARKFGIEQVRFEWVALCDSDDIWLPDMLQRRRWMHSRFPDARFSFSAFRKLRESGPSEDDSLTWATPAFREQFRPATGLPGVLRAEEPPYTLLLGQFQPVWPSASLFSMELYHQIGGVNPRFARVPSEDLELTLRCAEHAPWLLDTEPVVLIREHESNASRSQSIPRRILGEITILEHALRAHRSGSVHRREIVDAIVHRARRAIDLAFSDGDVATVRALLPRIPLRSYDFKLAAKAGVSRLPNQIATPLIGRLAGRRPA